MKIKNPLIPMGAITGRPDRARMDQVLRSYKAAGVDQFLIYPRSGMEIPYMSKDWLELCRGIVETAAELVKNSRSLVRVDVLPYQRAAGAKYEMVGREYAPDFDESVPPRFHTEIFDRMGIPYRVF